MGCSQNFYRCMFKRIFFLLKNICTVDLRSLAMMRIAIAMTLAVDLIIRWVNIKAHYTDMGILPLEALFRFGWNPYHFSIHTTGSIWQWELLIFLLNFTCILLLLVGYHTRLFTVFCWFFLLSIHNRNPLIHQGGDDLLRLILFWAMFLPWGYYYSVDAAGMGNKQQRSVSYTSLAVLGYVLQVMYVYVFSALLKNSPEWNSDFTALYYALSFDQIVLPVGKWLYPYEGFLRLLTACVYYIEMLVPFLLLIPLYTGMFRMAFIFIMTALHMGISLALNVGIFPLIAVTAMAGLVPGKVIDKLRSIKLTKEIAQSFDFSGSIPKRKPYHAPKESFLFMNVALFFIFYTFSWNLTTLGKTPALCTGKMEWIGHFFRVDQHWGMFAPSVFKDDGWFIFSGELENRKKVDALTGDTAVPSKRPDEIQALFRSDRWRKYAENFLFIANGHYRPYFCFYLMNNWNEKHEGKNKMRALKIFYVKEVSLPGYKVDKPLKEELCSCETHPAEKR
jgi:hypothetical protein